MADRPAAPNTDPAYDHEAAFVETTAAWASENRYREALQLMAIDFAPLLSIVHPQALVTEYLDRADKNLAAVLCETCGREMSTEEAIRSDFCPDCDPPKRGGSRG